MRWTRLAAALIASLVTAVANQSVPISKAEVRLELKDGRSQFQLGDIILLELVFRDPAFPERRASLPRPTPWQQTPGQVNVNVTDYSDLADDVTITPAKGWFHWQGHSGHDYMSMMPLDAAGARVPLVLNQCYVFRDPGHYEITVTTRRMGANPITTNSVSIEITPQSAADEAALVKTLDATISNTTGKEQRQAAEQLAYLTSDDAGRSKVEWLLRSDPQIATTMSNGLAATKNQGMQLALLKAAWVDPQHTPNGILLWSLKRAEAFASGQIEPGWVMAASQKEETNEYREDLDRLIATLPQRAGEVRRDTAYELIASNQLSAEQLALVKPVVLQEFQHMELLQQATLIESRWDVVKDPSLAPSLKAIIMIKDKANNPVAATALQRLIEIDPAVSRPYAVNMICRSERGLMLDKLKDLKEDRLPEVDRCLTTLLAKGEQHEHDFDWEQAAQRAARFATPAILPQVKAVWTNVSQDGSMLALLIRDAPQEAIALLDRKPEIDWYPANKVYETLGAKFPPEVLNWLRRSSAPQSAAAHELAQFGEPQDREILQQRLDELRKRWLSRETEMNDEARNEEAELVSSLLGARAWSLTSEEKLTLTANCLNDPCRFYAPH